MKQFLIAFLFLAFSISGKAQILQQRTTTGGFGNQGNSQSKDVGDVKRAPIDLYKIISYKRDTVHLDTTLSIQKEYKYNYLRKDDFELLPFSNVGQTYNNLAYTFDNNNLKPLFAAQSHHFSFERIQDINYYNVPTPLTELYFKTAFEQGQQLDAFFTLNTSKGFNFSIAYKGLRSLGKYQNILTSNGNFRFTTNFNSKNKKYRFRGHMVAQDVFNEENGGLTANSIVLFETEDPEFEDRGRLDVNFEDADNKLEALRFYGEQEYDLVRQQDSTSYNIVTIGNRVSYEDSFFQYNQRAAFAGFGPAYVSSSLETQTKLEDFQAEGYAQFSNSVIGSLGGFVRYTDFNYGYNDILELDAGRITNRLKGNFITVGANYKKQYKGFLLEGEGAYNVSGDLDGNFLQGAASFAFNERNKVRGSVTLHSVAPNFNFLLNQSDYVNYNWQNDFENVKRQELKFELESEQFFDAEVSYTGIDDFTNFTVQANDSTPTPQQFGERIDYLKVKVSKEIRYRKFALMNTVMYQQAVNGETVFNVPEIVTRQSLYYQDHWFKKALFLQTGINFKYFTSYNINAYDPVLAEFYVQNDQEIGGFPLVDIFFNAKIKQTRIFFKWEHFNQLFNSSNKQFSAPGYPYRDAVIRFGLVWDFFL